MYVYKYSEKEPLLRKYFGYCLYQFFRSLYTFFDKVDHIINIVTVTNNKQLLSTNKNCRREKTKCVKSTYIYKDRLYEYIYLYREGIFSTKFD